MIDNPGSLSSNNFISFHFLLFIYLLKYYCMQLFIFLHINLFNMFQLHFNRCVDILLDFSIFQIDKTCAKFISLFVFFLCVCMKISTFISLLLCCEISNSNLIIVYVVFSIFLVLIFITVFINKVSVY